MGKSQRDKGKAGEREVAHLLRKYGYIAERTRQSDGEQDPDVRVLFREDGPEVPLFVEVKRYARIGAIKWLRKTEEDAKVRRPCHNPIVFMRQDGDTRWSVLLDAEDFLGVLNDGSCDAGR